MSRRPARRRRATPSAANRGRSHEAALDAQHALYASRGAACIFRTPPEVKVLGAIRGGRFPACFAGSGPPDYLGVLPDGRGVALEAKETHASRWPLKDLQPHQAAAFDAWSCARGVALVVLAHRESRTTWALPWRTLGPRWKVWARGDAKRGEASLTKTDLVELGVQLDGVDWLAAVISRPTA